MLGGEKLRDLGVQFWNQLIVHSQRIQDHHFMCHLRHEQIGWAMAGDDGTGIGARVKEMLELFELGRWENELVESFSHGMKQRLVMSAAFLHRPQAVVVDEPMVGLDPRGARLIKDVFRKMSQRGVGILMSTHTLEVAQEMCDQISIILKGKIIASGTVAEIRAMGDSGDDHLTSVFLKLTGGSGLQEIDEIV